MADSPRRFFTVLPKNYIAFFIRLPLLLVISIGAIVFFFQDSLLHHPDRMQADRLAAEARRHRLHLWPSGTGYRGLLSISEVQKPIGTFLLFHGNAGSAVDRKWYADRLVPLGFRVLLLEYPGYGPRSGGLSEDVLVADAQESIVAAAKQFGRPLYVMGESLGSGVAAAAVAHSAELVDGLLLITPWDNLANVAQAIYWFLPAKLLLRDRYDSVDNLRRYSGPLVVIQAEQDEIVPGFSTKNLFDSYGSRKKLVRVPNSGHNTWDSSTDSKWWGEIADFLTRPS